MKISEQNHFGSLSMSIRELHASRALARYSVVPLTLALMMVIPAAAQWQYDVTLTGYPQARWKAPTSYIDKPALTDINGDGRPEIIAAGLFGDVYALDGRTGQILWSYEDEHSLELAVYICPVTVDVSCDGTDDVVSITPTGKVIALDGKNGRRLWSFQAENQIVHSPSAFDLNRDGNAEIAVSDVRGNLYLLDNLGKQLWKAPGTVPLIGTPALGMVGNQPMLLIGDRQGVLRALDGSTGNPLWKYESSAASPASTSPVLYKDTQNSTFQWRVLYGTENGEVHMLNAQNGQSIWSRRLTKGLIGEISLGDLGGTGALELVFSTTQSEVIAASTTGGDSIWVRKFKVPVREYRGLKRARNLGRETLAGQPVLADADGDGRLDVIVETRGLNSYVYGLSGTDGRILWNYGNKNLSVNPPVTESVVIAAIPQEEVAPATPFYTESVPVFSNPTPVLADFDGDGQADLIVNDRDEVGLINVPLSARFSPKGWSKYFESGCNNTMKYSISCLGTAPPPTVRLSLERAEITEGESVRLCWNTANSVGVDISEGLGTFGAENCVSVSPTRNTTWTVTARGCGGEARDTVTLAVKPKPPPPPPPPPPSPVTASPPPPPLSREAREMLGRRIADVFFEYDRYRLTAEARSILDRNVDQIKAFPGARFALLATCDERGSRIYNDYLARARAESVREYMAAQGIDPSRLEIRAEGETTKFDSRRTEAGWAKNRRVSFAILP